MSDYVVDEFDDIEIPMYIDKREKGYLKVYSEEQAKALYAEEKALWKKRVVTLEVKEKLTEEEEKEKIELKTKIESDREVQEHLIKEMTVWKKPDGAADEYINQKGWDRNDVTGKTKYNPPQYDRAFMAVLLKSWTLDKDSPKLKLTFMPMPGFQDRHMLSVESINNIWGLKHEILNFLNTIPYKVIFKEKLTKK